jgi:hypothetical protein
MSDSADALVKLAIKAGDPFVAAAVHELATGALKQQLEQLILESRRTALSLAKWEHTPASVLTALSGIGDDAVDLRLDKNPNTAPSVLSNLYVDASNKGNLNLTKLIAQHRNSEAAVLKSIALFAEDAESLLALSKNPSANAEVLACLSARMLDDELSVALNKNIAQNNSASAELLEHIYERSDVHTQAAIIGHVNCPDALIAQAMTSDDLLIMRTLARDARISTDVLLQYAKSDDAGVRCGVAANAKTPVSVIGELVSDKSEMVRREIASRNDLLPVHIVKLLVDADAWVRQRLARNAIAPLPVMRALAGDTHADVRRAVARNTQCPLELLEILAVDENSWVRAAVSYQHHSPQQLLVELAADEDVDVLSGVANNPNTPQQFLEKLVASSEADVRRGVILNKAATRKTLLPLLEDPYYLHRVLMVANPSLQELDKWNLREDPDYQVRFSVYRWAVKNIAPINARYIVGNEVIRRRRV